MGLWCSEVANPGAGILGFGMVGEVTGFFEAFGSGREAEFVETGFARGIMKMRVKAVFVSLFELLEVKARMPGSSLRSMRRTRPKWDAAFGRWIRFAGEWFYSQTIS